MRTVRLLASVALAGTLALAGVVTGARPAAAAEEVYPAPASGYWDVDGRGWGHGIGMSQWGALGAAQQGVGYRSILDFYYPGTTMSTVPNSDIRVALTAYAPTGTVTLGVPAGQKMTVTDSTTGARVVNEAVGRFTVRRDAPGYTIEQRDRINGTVRATYTSSASQLTFSTGDGVAVFPRQDETDGTWYRGNLRLVGSASVPTAFDVVNHLPLEDYLRGVVPRESPSGWHADALRAQAVAARSYALTEHKAKHFDTCDTTQCQVYGGRAAVVADGADFKPASKEAASTDKAVSDTAGEVRWYDGQVAFTQFSATNGGYSRQGSKPYLVARPDPYTGTATGDSRTRWTDRLQVSTVAKKCPSGGSLRNLVVVSRDGNGELGGRIQKIRLECTTENVELTSTGDAAFRMFSHWWRPTAPPQLRYGFFLNDAWTSEANHEFQYGRYTDEVFVGDWDGDGTDTLAVRRANTFFVTNTLRGGQADVTFAYGRPGDTVLVGDWDGDGKDTFAVRRGNEYHVKNSVTGGPADKVIAYGRASDAVVVGDWDGNDTDTFAVRRGNLYHVKNSISGGAADTVVPYGRATDDVYAGDWDGNGTDTFTVRRGNQFHIKNTIASGAADRVLSFGRATDIVLVGDWDGNGTDTLGVRRLP
ncbi:SpoIID/LytB domain-containing protein [Georgenia sp. EYE_87]|uniref:SpoIID/LytB domain-containing protein n=1 Tax=Georgenia sp. EYE_87 TaxID=2853448 RepID=UPI002005AEDE|nr:SpoIID/LytB domain-containing protein [Georgenia sp. EYE_87]MCK6211784.1 SpoIID/LytB domain-containing protein [Georgenia sp. EYE_87]